MIRKEVNAFKNSDLFLRQKNWLHVHLEHFERFMDILPSILDLALPRKRWEINVFYIKKDFAKKMIDAGVQMITRMQAVESERISIKSYAALPQILPAILFSKVFCSRCLCTASASSTSIVSR
jgi:hypothetical protein